MRFGSVTPRATTGKEKKTGRTSSKLTEIEAPRTPPRAIVYEITGVLLLACGALLLYNARLPAEEIRGFVPQLGVGILRWLFGIGALALPALMCLLGSLLIVRRHRANVRAFGRGAATGFGTLGYALPAAIGAKVGRPEAPVVCIIGDGGLHFTMPELASAADAGAPVIVLLWNDRRYGEIEEYMVRYQIAPLGVRLHATDFAAMAKAFGAEHVTARSSAR